MEDNLYNTLVSRHSAAGGFPVQTSQAMFPPSQAQWANPFEGASPGPGPRVPSAFQNTQNAQQAQTRNLNNWGSDTNLFNTMLSRNK